MQHNFSMFLQMWEHWSTTKSPSFTTVLYIVVTMCASSIFTRSSVRIATLPQTSTAKISWRQLQSHHHPPPLEQFWVVLESSLRLSLRPCNFYVFFSWPTSAGRHVLNITSATSHAFPASQYQFSGSAAKGPRHPQWPNRLMELVLQCDYYRSHVSSCSM